MYPDSGYKRVHVQSVCTSQALFPPSLKKGLGTRLTLYNPAGQNACNIVLQIQVEIQLLDWQQQDQRTRHGDCDQQCHSMKEGTIMPRLTVNFYYRTHFCSLMTCNKHGLLHHVIFTTLLRCLWSVYVQNQYIAGNIWRKVNLAVGSQITIANILTDLNLVVR